MERDITTMKVLILCNTYYQLIVAMQMKKTIFKEAEVSVIISDHSSTARKVYENIIKLNCFSKVYYKETKWFREYSKNVGTVIFRLLKGGFFSDITLEKYDEFVFYNFEFSTNILYNELSKKNPSIKASRFEEGFLSYKYPMVASPKIKIFQLMNMIRNKNNLIDATKTFYCFYPQFYEGALEAKIIPTLSTKSEVVEIISKSFDVNLDIESYKEKYIFFASIYDFEGENPIGEYELVCKIADLVGEDNLLVKIHPRDTRTVFEDNGFKVDKNSGVPWEAIQLSRDFSDKVFLTATSGSVLAGSFMSEKSPKTFFMHKCCDIESNSSARYTVEKLEEFLCDKKIKEELMSVFIVTDVKDILV